MVKLIVPLIASLLGVLVGAVVLFACGMVVLVCVAEEVFRDE